MTRSIIATYYGKYHELIEGLEDELIFDNDKIEGYERDTGDIRKNEDVETDGMET